MKRFISEYAKYKINSYENNKLMGADIKTELISNIHKALDLSKKSYISVDEAIRMINENWMKYWFCGKFWKVENIMKVKVNKISKEEQSENKAIKALNFIINSNGGLTDKQIESIEELIDAGFIEAINEYELRIHN